MYLNIVLAVMFNMSGEIERKTILFGNIFSINIRIVISCINKKESNFAKTFTSFIKFNMYCEKHCVIFLH